MEINRVSSIYPVIRVEGYKKNMKDDKKGKNEYERNKKDFENELNSKKRDGANSNK